MKKIISYSLWGDTPMYNVGAVENATNAEELYPDWICRYYVGESVPSETLEKLSSKSNTEVILVKSENDWTSSTWRFLAIDDSDIVIFRDTDSRLTNRERVAVDEWLESGKPVHIMRDHPYHTENILAGMWGVRSKVLMEVLNEKTKGEDFNSFRNFIEIGMQQIAKETELNFKGVDQQLTRAIYHVMENFSYIQDQFSLFDDTTNKFSTNYENPNDFIGQVYDENNVPTKEFADLLRDAVCKNDPNHAWKDLETL